MFQLLYKQKKSVLLSQWWKLSLQLAGICSGTGQFLAVADITASRPVVSKTRDLYGHCCCFWCCHCWCRGLCFNVTLPLCCHSLRQLPTSNSLVVKAFTNPGAPRSPAVATVKVALFLLHSQFCMPSALHGSSFDSATKAVFCCFHSSASQPYAQQSLLLQPLSCCRQLSLLCHEPDMETQEHVSWETQQMNQQPV